VKEFRYKDGRVRGKTMTCAELITVLQQHPADMPVMATWESVNAYLEESEVMIVDKSGDDPVECLVFDVEHY